MAAQGAPTLSNGPPLPPGLAPAAPPQQATMQGLAGQQGAPSGSAGLQQAIVQKLMFVEQALNDIGTMLPAAAPVANGLIDQMRKGMGGILAQGAQPPPAQGPAQMAGAMLAPGGAPTS